MNILITICARGGSKGIPGKNIKLLNGIPLIAYTINIAKEFSKLYNSNISISTDSLEIKKVVSEYLVTSDYIRPDYLATDNAGKLDTIKDLLNFEEKRNHAKQLTDLYNQVLCGQCAKDNEDKVVVAEESTEHVDLAVDLATVDLIEELHDLNLKTIFYFKFVEMEDFLISIS